MSTVKVTDLLIQLINASEKAAQIARLCRAEEELFKLLVQEKCCETKNPRFVQDFKTLADVLVQETIKYDLAQKFPGISNRIYGEENNKFENSIGESVIVKIDKSSKDTSDLLLRVLDGNKKAAQLLANAVHSTESNDFDSYLKELLDEDLTLDLNLNEISVWIDPIDSTSEYVNGFWETHNQTESIIVSGLKCVTCLIGVYQSSTGIPLIGVANQPFYTLVEPNIRSMKYSGRSYWGFNINGLKRNNITNELKMENVVLIGGNETESNIKRLEKHNRVIYAAGAGYKLLCVALSLSDIYLSSQPSTYRWDTCALHAILKSMDGGIITYSDSVQFEDILDQTDNYQLNYLENQNSTNHMSKWCNSKGIIAYRNFDCLKSILSDLMVI